MDCCRRSQIAGSITGEKMKPAMGLVLAVFAFAVVTHADGMTYGGSDYAMRAGAELRFEAPSTGALHGADLLIRRGDMAFGAGRAFLVSGDAERLTDFVFYSHFGDSEEAVERPIESESMRLRLESIWGDHHEGSGEFLRIEHPDPFRREVAVQDVSEPETLLLMGAGLAALALWRRRTSASEQKFVRFF
jgi:hypothetical protein